MAPDPGQWLHVHARRTWAAVCALLVLGPALAAAPGVGASAGESGSGSACPGARPLVTTVDDWSTHRLARGVRLREGTAKDGRGTVDIHVLTARVTRPNLSFRPLMRHVAQRTALSVLSAGRHRLVASTNTGYYDFFTGAPTAPVIEGKHPLTVAAARQHVVGFGANGRLQAGDVWMAGRLSSGETSRPIAGVNLAKPAAGITVYTQKWGHAAVQLRWSAVTRSVVDGAVADGSGWRRHVPDSGQLLVATGSHATSWLRTLKPGDTVSARGGVRTTASHAFTQAYGVGVQLVRDGKWRDDLSCRASDPTPARTAIGWADGGRKLVIALVTDRPWIGVHGLDPEQMSRLMDELGATQAYAWDGSGSTQLMARMPHKGLRLRTYPADGAERPMPVGFGIFAKRH